MPELFRTGTPLKFHVYNFHDDFDILLGINNIKKLQAKVNFEKDLFILENSLNSLKFIPLGGLI